MLVILFFAAVATLIIAVGTIACVVAVVGGLWGGGMMLLFRASRPFAWAVGLPLVLGGIGAGTCSWGLGWAASQQWHAQPPSLLIFWLMGYGVGGVIGVLLGGQIGFSLLAWSLCRGEGWSMLVRLWVLPNTLLGLASAPVVVLQGGRIAMVDGVIEITGGVVSRVLHGPLPCIGSASAITLGHVVWGIDQAALDRTRAHERVHVAQYERWGPLFLPAYLLSSLMAWQAGRDPYRDNRFERQAYTLTPS